VKRVCSEKADDFLKKNSEFTTDNISPITRKTSINKPSWYYCEFVINKQIIFSFCEIDAAAW